MQNERSFISKIKSSGQGCHSSEKIVNSQMRGKGVKRKLTVSDHQSTGETFIYLLEQNGYQGNIKLFLSAMG